MLEGKRIIVTGSARGMGEATLKAYVEAGANVIGLAPQNTSLSRLCNLAIYVNMEEDLESFTPVSSRIAHLVVIDVLATGVALHRKPLLKEHLKRLEKSQRALRTPGPG